MNSFYFDYDTFYKYYTKKSNLTKDESTPLREIWHYKKEKYHNQIPEKTILSNKYITIGTIKIYISKKDTDGLYFTIPEKKGDKWWDNHFHLVKLQLNLQIKNINPTQKIKKFQWFIFIKLHNILNRIHLVNKEKTVIIIQVCK
jgi:hypothetical protein